MNDIPHSIEVVSKGALRRRFNEGRYWHRILIGELWQTLEEDGHPSPAPAGEPYCTYSQIFAYHHDSDGQIARVHQYLRPDGRIGGPAGKPEPKELIEDGVLYVVVDPEDWGGAEGTPP